MQSGHVANAVPWQLMTERNLRALDVRHTLPNLKNLLLTLTDPDTADPRYVRQPALISRLIMSCRPHRPLSVASTTISALQSPVLAPSLPPEASPSVPDSAETLTIRDHPVEADSPPPSGSTTPTKSVAEPPTPTNTVRKPRGFLDLSGFFRGRQPSSTRSSSKAESSSTAENHDGAGAAAPSANGDAQQPLDEGNAGGDDEDDRRTIRAGASEDAAEGKSTANTHANGRINGNGNGNAIAHNHQQSAAEKAAADAHASQVVAA